MLGDSILRSMYDNDCKGLTIDDISYFQLTGRCDGCNYRYRRVGNRYFVTLCVSQ